jgi:hypothetical protein
MIISAGCIFQDDDSAMGDLISVGASTPKLDDSTDDGDIMDVDAEPIGRNKAGKKKARTKATAKTPLSPARPARKRKGKGSKAKSKAVDTNNELEGASHKHRKGIELPLSPIANKEVLDITSGAVASPKPLGDIQSLSQPSSPKDSSVALEPGDDHNLFNPSPRPSQPCSPSLVLPASPLAHPSLLSTTTTPAAASTHKAQSDQPPDVQDGCLCCVSEEESTNCGYEMEWNDSGSHDWNGGSDHTSQLAIRHNGQSLQQDCCPSVAFDDIFNKRQLALSSRTSAASSPVRSSSTVMHGMNSIP